MNDFADDVPPPEGPPGQPPEPPRTSPPEVDGDPHAGHDPDGEELVFLERSLADLDAEKSAGDISEDDHRSLSGLYAERVAAVRRRHGGRSAGRNAGAGNPRRGRRLMAVLVTVAMLGTGVGVGLASALGHRSSVDTTTGDIRQSTRGMLFEAQEHMAAGRWAEAEALYAAVLAAQPSSAEALAWWGWLDLLRGDLESADERLAAAVAADPLYPDARVFGAVVTLRLGRPDTAAAHLDAFDAVGPPPLMVELVETYELRPRILAARLAAAEVAGDAAATETLLAASTPDEMAAAARHLADGGQVVLAARLFGAALEADPPTCRRWSAAAPCSPPRTSPPSRTCWARVWPRSTGLLNSPRTIRRPGSGVPWPPPAWDSSTTPWPTSTTWRHSTRRRPPDRGSPPRGGDPRRRRERLAQLVVGLAAGLGV